MILAWTAANRVEATRAVAAAAYGLIHAGRSRRMPSRMPTTLNKTIAWAGALALLVLHLDFWRDRGTSLLMGWMPQELAWRMGWMLLSTLYLVWFCRAIWVEED